MLRLAGSVAVLLACSSLIPASAVAEVVEPDPVTATVETDAVRTTGDSADDPTIWVHPDDPSASLVIANNKKESLETYGLDGHLVQRVQTSTAFVGNSDVRQGVTIGRRTLDVVAVANGGLRLFTVDPATRLLHGINDGGPAREGRGEGLCAYVSAVTGSTYVFAITRPGVMTQILLSDADDDGLLETRPVRTVNIGSEAEGCVADDATGALYVSQEDVALWRYGAEPGDGTARTALDTVQPGGRIAPDAEGVALVDLGGSHGYVVLSSQSAADPLKSSFLVYERQSGAFVRAVQVIDGPVADGCSRTDGIAASTAALGQAFPLGLFVCQDDRNVVPGGIGRQNFKLVPLQRVVDLGPAPDRPPVARFTSSCTDTVCELDASGSTDDTGISSWIWDLGDGTAGEGPILTHDFVLAEDVTVTLTVTDPGGASHTVSALLRLSPLAQLSFVAAAGSSSVSRTAQSVQVPTAVRPGDRLVLVLAAGSAVGVADPAGWTRVAGADVSGVTGRVWTRVAGTADPGSGIRVTTSTKARTDLTVAAYTSDLGTPSVRAAAVLVDATSTALRTTPVLTAQEGDWLVQYWAERSPRGTALVLPDGVERRTSSTSPGKGHLTAALGDLGRAATPGPAGGLLATGDSRATRGITVSVLLAGP